jgi:hypothetical protein
VGAFLFVALVGGVGLGPGCKDGTGTCPPVKDDRLACTIDTCESGQSIHTPMPEGATCLEDGHLGICAGARCMVPCKADADCEDASECTTDTCAGGVCYHVTVAGSPVTDDGNACTKDMCIDDKVVHIPHSHDAICGSNGQWRCDGIACGGCEVDSDCGAVEACRRWECDEHKQCILSYKDAGIPVTEGNIKGDCRALECDGWGNVIAVPHKDDVPLSDGKPCTEDRCIGMTAVYTPIPIGEKCFGGFCDGQGSCVQCLEDAHCDANERCYHGACSSCSNGVQDGDETSIDCGGERCGQCLGKTCAENTSCASGFCVDNVCCGKSCAICFRCDLPGAEGTCKATPYGGPICRAAATATRATVSGSASRLPECRVRPRKSA